MGSLFAAYLTEGGLDVTLVDKLPARAAQLRASGIVVKGVRGEHRVRVRVTTDAASVGPAELVMVCVKAYDTEQALTQHLALVGPETVVWSVQNGLGNVEAMARVVSESHVVGGSTTLGANLLRPGLVHHAGDGNTIMGEIDGSRSERVERLARTLSGAGIPILVSDDIGRAIWSKLLINVGINALTALLWVRNGGLVEHEPPREVMREAVAEAVRAAGEQGLDFDIDQVQARVEEVARLTGQNRSSMLVDIQTGQRTEIDYITGALARLGRAPVNQTLTSLIRAMEATAAQRQTLTG